MLNRWGSRLFVVLFSVAGACSRQGDEGGETTNRQSVSDSAGARLVMNHTEVRQVERIPIGELELSIGEAEGDVGDLLARVGGATRLADGSIAIADNGSSSIRIYDGSGRLTGSMGRRGEGPREFVGVLGPWSVDSGDARLAAYDFRGQRITTLTNSGEFLAVRSLLPPSANPASVAGVLQDLTVVQVERAWEAEPGELTQVIAHVVVFGPPRWSRDTIYSTPTNRRGFVALASGREVMAGPLFEPSFSASAGAGRIVVSDCKTPEFRVLAPDGQLRSVVRWSAGDRTTTSEAVAKLREEMIDGMSPDQAQSVLERLDAVPVREEFPSCDSPHPLLGAAVRIGANGDVWVREFTRPGTVLQAWLRFRDGILLGRLQLDLSFAVQEFGEEYVIVVERDDLEVERVRLYSIPTSPASSRSPT